MPKLRIGLIGCGGMMGYHARGLNEIPEAAVLALADADPLRAESFRKSWLPHVGHRAPAFADYRQMIEQVPMDGVVISTPHGLHFEQICFCLNRGLHVLVEKPIATSARDARAVMEMAQKLGRLVGICYQRHFTPHYILAHQIIESGVIGGVSAINAYLGQKATIWKDPSSWRSDPKLGGGGIFIDSGSHFVDMILWYGGARAERVYGQFDQRIDQVAAVNFRLENGVIGSLTLSAQSPPWTDQVTVFGEKGVLFVDGQRVWYELNEPRQVVRPLEMPEGSSPVRNFVDALLGCGEIGVPPSWGLKVAEFTEAAYRSFEIGKPVMAAALSAGPLD